ncbi:MAG: hypothetical protein JJ979_02635 [Roseibium sp.]|nr:hypothetical protein [Roseibium sp.]
MKRFGISIITAFALSLVTASTIAHAGTINLCTGGEGGPYHTAGKMIAKQMVGSGTDVVVKTSSGTWDNIQRSTGDEPDCNAFVGQPDGHAVFARENKAEASNLRKVATLHREYLHVLCNAASGVDALDELESDPAGNGYSVAVGEVGSGSWLIWQNFIVEDEDYAAVPTHNDGDIFALTGVASGTYTCMLVPAGLGNSVVTSADNDFSGELVLASAVDKDFNDAVDPKGDPLYEFEDIPGDTYETSLQRGWGGSVETVSWLAGVYVNSSQIDRKDLANFMKGANRAKAQIRAEYGS